MNDLVRKQVSSIMQISIYREIFRFILFNIPASWWHLKWLNLLGKEYRFTRFDETARGRTSDSWDSFIVIMAKEFMVWNIVTIDFKKCANNLSNAHTTPSTHDISNRTIESKINSKTQNNVDKQNQISKIKEYVPQMWLWTLKKPSF